MVLLWPIGAAMPRPLAAASDAPISHPTGASDLVLRVEAVGGFVPEEVLLRRVPGFSLFGDGRAISVATAPAGWDALLPVLRTLRLTESGVQRLLTAARDAGLTNGDRNYDGPCVTDMPTVVFTTVAQGRTSRVSAYALGFDPDEGASVAERIVPRVADAVGGGDGCSGDEEARGKLVAFAAVVDDLPAALPESSFAEDDEPYPVDRLQIVVQPIETTPSSGGADPPPESETTAWPLDVPLGGIGDPYREPTGGERRCAVVAGAEAVRLADALAEATVLPHWVSGGREFLVVPRPLLPDEAGCA